MLIDLYQFLQEDMESKSYKPQPEKSFKMKDLEYDMVDCDLTLQLDNHGNRKIGCRLDGYVCLTIPCERCLKPVLSQIDISFDKELDMNKSAEEKIRENDEECFVSDFSLDTDVLIHNEILMNLPMKVLCSADCKGICHRCGANLNDGPCRCQNTELDSRMSKILDVFNQFKEV